MVTAKCALLNPGVWDLLVYFRSCSAKYGLSVTAGVYLSNGVCNLVAWLEDGALPHETFQGYDLLVILHLFGLFLQGGCLSRGLLLAVLCAHSHNALPLWLPIAIAMGRDARSREIIARASQ